MLSVGVGVPVLYEICQTHSLVSGEEDPTGLTKLDVIVTEVVHSVEAPVEDLSGPLQGVEGDVERVPGAEDHEVPHLAAVGPDLLCQVVRSVVDSEAVKRTAGTKTWNLGPVQPGAATMHWIINFPLNYTFKGEPRLWLSGKTY